MVRQEAGQCHHRGRAASAAWLPPYLRAEYNRRRSDKFPVFFTFTQTVTVGEEPDAVLFRGTQNQFFNWFPAKES